MDETEVRSFLSERFAPHDVEAIERLGGGAWSHAFGFRAGGRELVARFGRWSEDFEADERAMAWSGPDLPVPVVLEVGDAFGGAYALSERHHGVFLEDLDEPTLRRLLPALLRALDAMRALPVPVRAGDEPTWPEWLLETLLDVPGGRVSGWRARLADDPALDELFVRGERRMASLFGSCPTEPRHVLHLDLLHGNVLVARDGSRLEAVFDWGCTAVGDFVYELAWFSFWSPWHRAGLAAVDVAGAARAHLEAQGLDLPGFAERLRCYELHIGLTHLAYHAFTGEEDELAAVAERLAALLDGP